MTEPSETSRCGMTVERMHLFFDEELSEVEAHAVRVHISECEDCEDCYGVEEALRAAIRRCLCGDSAPASLRARVQTLHVRFGDPR